MEELKRARENYELARYRFSRVSIEPPGIRVFSDHERRIQDAFRLQTDALNNVAAALRQFNEYLLNGRVPEHLREKTLTRAAGA